MSVQETIQSMVKYREALDLKLQNYEDKLNRSLSVGKGRKIVW